MISPYYTFVVEDCDFHIPTTRLEEISPIFLLLAHHASCNVIELHDVDKFEFSILYQFVIAGVLPHKDILEPRNHGENLLQLADYLLVDSFRDFLQTNIFCASIPRFSFNESVIRTFQLANACNSPKILHDSALNISNNLENAFTSLTTLSFIRMNFWYYCTKLLNDILH